MAVDPDVWEDAPALGCGLVAGQPLCLTLWQDDRDATTSGVDIYGALIDLAAPTPSVGPDFPVSVAASDQLAPGVAEVGGLFVAAWEDGRLGGHDIFATRVASGPDVSPVDGLQVSDGLANAAGDLLRTAEVLDAEAIASYSLRARTDDGRGGTFEAVFAVAVDDANDAPTGLELSSTEVAENSGAGTLVGVLSTTDPDAADSHAYALIGGAGAGGNGAFAIVGDELRTAVSLDFEAQSAYSVRIRSDDGHGGALEVAFAIGVTDANDAPTDIALTNAEVAENSPVGSPVGALLTADQDAGDTHVYTFAAGAGDTDNGAFEIVGNELRTAAAVDFETRPTLGVRVRSPTRRRPGSRRPSSSRSQVSTSRRRSISTSTALSRSPKTAAPSPSPEPPRPSKTWTT